MKAHTFCFSASAKRWLAIGMLMAMILLIAAVPAYAAMATDEFYPDDTDGTEMQLMEPAQLELYFGPEWAGAQFTLETDVGGYPGTIPVANDGSMRMDPSLATGMVPGYPPTSVSRVNCAPAHSGPKYSSSCAGSISCISVPSVSSG